MLNKLQKRNSKGFTIIEVMIVLAIAALILLIVLLAVPALQRSSRNTAIKNDASTVAGAIGDFASNNNGAIPTGAKSSYTAGTASLNNATGVASTAKVQASDVITFGDATTAKVTPTPGTIYVDFGAKCAALTANDVTPVAQPRATAIIYATEASGQTQAQCLDS